MNARQTPSSHPLPCTVMWAVAATPALVLLAGRGYPSGVVGEAGLLAGLWLLVWIAGWLVVGLTAVVVGVLHWSRGGRLLPGWRQVGLAAGVFAVGVLMIRFEALLQVRFAAARAAFDQAAGQAPPANAGRIGGCRVLEAARDPRGGVYFKTGESPDIVDTDSFGFVRDPNADGSPFGNADYRLVPLGGGWHRFEANNDW